MEWYMPTEYIDIENVSGFFNEKRIFIDKISNVILSDKPVELQELMFFDKGRGHRTALSCRPTLSFDFTANEQSPPFISKLHKHDYYEIIIAAVGIVEMQIESRLCQLNEGDVCVLNRSTQHAEHFKTGQKVFYITITPEYIKNWPKDEGTGLPRLIAKLFDKGMDVPLYQNKDYIIAAGSNNDSLPGILSVIENIREEFEGKKPGYHFFVRGLLYRFFCTITNSKLYSIEYIDLGMDEGFSLAFSAKQIIDKNLRRTSKDEIAQKLQYNGEYINQVFKKHYGYTIPEYSRMVCIRQMASLLITTSIPVDVICGQLGFVNRTHLYKLFTKEYACTPDEYRKNAGSLRGIKGKSLRRV